MLRVGHINARESCSLGNYSLGFHTQNKVPITVSYVSRSLCCIGRAGSGGFSL